MRRTPDPARCEPISPPCNRSSSARSRHLRLRRSTPPPPSCCRLPRTRAATSSRSAGARTTSSPPITHHDYPAVDIAAPMGSPLYALANSVVVRSWSTPDPACGIGLTLQAFDGQVWTYCHLSVLDPNVVPAALTAGEAVGLVGATGDATGPHLHLQLHRRQWPQQEAWFRSFAGTGVHLVGCRSARREQPRALSLVPAAQAPLFQVICPRIHPRSGVFHPRRLGSAPDLPTRVEMASRLRAHLPRVALFVLLGLAATATLTYAAGRQLSSTPAASTTAAPTPPLVVPDVRNQAFVFAKGTLEDAGFAWRVPAPCTATPRTRLPRSLRPPARACSTRARRSSP